MHAPQEVEVVSAKKKKKRDRGEEEKCGTRCYLNIWLSTFILRGIITWCSADVNVPQRRLQYLRREGGLSCPLNGTRRELGAVNGVDLCQLRATSKHSFIYSHCSLKIGVFFSSIHACVELHYRVCSGTRRGGCEAPLRGDVQFSSQASLDECVLDTFLPRPGQTQRYIAAPWCSPAPSRFVDNLADFIWGLINSKHSCSKTAFFILAVYCMRRLCIMVLGCNIMYEAGSLEAATSSSHVTDCLMDDPNCPCSLLRLLFGYFVNLVQPSLWTRATL